MYLLSRGVHDVKVTKRPRGKPNNPFSCKEGRVTELSDMSLQTRRIKEHAHAPVHSRPALNSFIDEIGADIGGIRKR